MALRAEVVQCQSCPWKVGCVPDRDIPNGYSRTLHKALNVTIAQPGSMCSTGVGMACHYSKVGEEFPCAGWLFNQLGDGNNIPLRIDVARGRVPIPKIDGKQHATFAATLRRRKPLPDAPPRKERTKR